MSAPTLTNKRIYYRIGQHKAVQLGLLILIPVLWIWIVGLLTASEVYSVIDHINVTNSHVQALQQTLKSFNPGSELGNTDALQGELDQIQNQFNDVSGDLNYFNNEMSRYHGLIEFAKVVTPFRADLETAQYLLDGGHKFVEAGNRALATGKTAINSLGNLSNISIAGLDNPDSTDTSTTSENPSSIIAPATLDQIQSGLTDVKQMMTEGITSFNLIPYSELKQGGTTARIVDQFRSQISTLGSGLDDATKVLGVVRRVLGFDEPANYLVMVQDADELRANGGFAGNYMVLTVSQGALVSFLFDNTYKPDDAIANKEVVTVPQPYFDWWGQNNKDLRFRFGLRDSTSMTPDWPNTAQIMQGLLLKEEVSGNLTGMIALNFGLIKNLLQITGPVYVTSLPDYNHEEVNADNFTERIHYHQALDQQQQGLNSLQRKKFTRYLAAEVLAAIKKLPKNKLADVGKAAVNSLDQKDLILYFSDPTAEKLIDGLGWTGRINESKSSPNNSDKSDYLYFVDDNVAANKTNAVIRQQITDTVSFNLDGSATHRSTLSYDYFGMLPQYDRYGRFDHQAYSRYYIPQDSQMIERNGFDSQSGLVQQYGRDVWGQLIAVPANQKRTCNVSWRTPAYYGLHQSGQNIIYNLILQRQPAANFVYNIKINPPEGMKITGVEGVAKPTNNSDGSVTVINGLLSEDLSVKITFSVK